MREYMESGVDPSPDYENRVFGAGGEPPSSLVLLPLFRWRSLGGFLNYENWPERERFLELDQAILTLKAQQGEDPLENRGRIHDGCEHFNPSPRRQGLTEGKIGSQAQAMITSPFSLAILSMEPSRHLISSWLPDETRPMRRI
jgi:hypothetical protein